MRTRAVAALVAVLFLGLIGYRVALLRKAGTKPIDSLEQGPLVRVARVQRASMPDILSLTGTVRPRNEVDLFPKVGGRVLTLGAKVGDHVRANQQLATIEHKELSWQAQAAEAALQVAEANLKGARLEHDRTAALFRGGAAPQAQVDGVGVRLALAQAQAAQARAAAGLANQAVDNARVLSPISGTVIRRPVNVGMQVGPSQALFTIQDLAALKLEGAVDASGFGRLALGKEAVVTVDALPGKQFRGRLSTLSPALDAQTRRAALEVEIDNSEGQLLANMFARADIVLGHLDNALVVPKEAVLEAAGGAVVFRIRGDLAEAVRPKLGPGNATHVAVMSGLSDNDEVAVTALAAIIDGMPVRVSHSTPGAAEAAALR